MRAEESTFFFNKITPKKSSLSLFLPSKRFSAIKSSRMIHVSMIDSQYGVRNQSGKGFPDWSEMSFGALQSKSAHTEADAVYL